MTQAMRPVPWRACGLVFVVALLSASDGWWRPIRFIFSAQGNGEDRDDVCERGDWLTLSRRRRVLPPSPLRFTRSIWG